MNRTRSILGLVVGLLMLLSAGAHSLLGWPQLRGELTALTAPADLVGALGMGWHFGGLAMLAFGAIVVALFAQRLRGAPASLLPANVIGATYALFGAGVLVAKGFDPFFLLVFLVPGVLLLFAGLSRRPA